MFFNDKVFIYLIFYRLLNIYHQIEITIVSEISRFIERLDSQANEIKFEEVIALIDRFYHFTPSAFSNGTQKNVAGDNNGSCKVFSFAKQHSLSKEQTLCLFAQYYQDVLATPDGDDHQNIRQFMEHGYQGLIFESVALVLINESKDD